MTQHPLSPTEKAIYGDNAARHPITDMPLEMGVGALSAADQARRVHLPEIFRTQGAAAADAMRIKVDAEQRRLAIANS